MDTSETWLIERAREGDVSSFSALVEMHQERVIRSAYSILGNVEDAKDSAQEAFVKAFSNLQNFNQESKFYTWLYRILINVCKDFLRKKKVRRTFSIWTTEDGEEKNITDQMESRQNTDSSKILANKELEQNIYSAMETLPFQQRTAFGLRYLDGLTIEEIADSMELSQGAVKAHLWHAGEKLKKILKHTFVTEVQNG